MAQAVRDITWTAQPRQATFLEMVLDPTGPDEILYGGAAGGGKTDALLIACIIYADHFGVPVLFLRKTYPELEQKPIPRSKELIPRSMAKYNETKHRWDFYRSGGILQFGSLDKAKDVEKYQSAEYALIAFDELTHFLEFQYIYLMSRNRCSKGNVKSKMISGTNPGSRGHLFVKKRWIDPAKPEVVWETPRTPEMVAKGIPAKRRVFIPAKLGDNQILMKADPGYEANLLMLPEQLKKALYDGDWDAFEGQKFSEFSKEIHVIKPFNIPKWWRRWMGHDPGYDNPFYWAWLAVDGDGNVYLYREYARKRDDPVKMFYRDQAAKVVDLSRYRDMVKDEVTEQTKEEEFLEEVDYICTGKDAWNLSRETSKTYVDYYQEGGIPWAFIPANTDRRFRAQTMHEYLRPFEDPETGKLISKFHVFDTCTEFIETLPALVSDDNDAEKVADDPKVDNPYDAVGYGLISYHTGQSKPPKEEEPPIARHKNKLARQRQYNRRRLS